MTSPPGAADPSETPTPDGSILDDTVSGESVPDGPPGDDLLADRYAWPTALNAVRVRANMIASLDGRAALDGKSGALGNDADRRLFAILRDLADVVLVGAGTVRAEGYRGVELDDARRARRVRWTRPAAPPPIAVVTRRGLDPESGFFTVAETPPIVITTRQAAATVPAGATVIATGDEINLRAALLELGALGLRRVNCEGGPALLADLLAADLVDELCLTLAPRLLGSAATPLVPSANPPPRSWRLTTAWVSGDHVFTRYQRPALPP